MKTARLIPPPIIALILTITAYFLGIILPKANIILLQSNIISLALTAMGILTTVWSVLLFREMGTTLNPNADPKKMVTRGPYKISRNPMYLGIFLILLGIFFWSGGILFFLATIIFFILMDRETIPNEEKNLEKTVGKDRFTSYTQKTRRWL